MDDLTPIFMPRAVARLKKLKEPGSAGLVHYTSAQSAVCILKDRAIWMRNARCLNDVSEMQHGCSRIRDALDKNDRRKRLIGALNKFAPGAADGAFVLFQGQLPSILTKSYITCVSEHHHNENQHGRLSMWRGYGREAVGVALVLNKNAFFAETNSLNAFSSPVAYLTDDEVAGDIETIIANIGAHGALIRNAGIARIKNIVFAALLFGSTCLKHPGFSEEHEWRVIHSPEIFPSKALVRSIQIVGGVPQTVYSIPLKDFTSTGGANFSPDNLITNVIVGPSNYPDAVREALICALEGAGVRNAERKVIVSDIPLRV